MLPLDLFGKSLSPPFIHLPEDNSVVFSSGALTPQKRTTTEPHTNVPLAKRIQLSSKSDTSDLLPEDSPTMNVVVGPAMSPNNFITGPNSLDTSNIVGTPAFITTLMMKYIKFSDEQRQAEEKQASFWQSTFLLDNTVVSPISNNNGENSILSSAFEGALTNARTTELCCSTPKLLSTKARNSIVSTGSNDDLEMNDDDECLLSNLPTSVDDLQDKEQQIKLERQINSPLRSHRQSPNGFEAGRLSVLSGGSHAMNGIHFSTSSYPNEELDADDMEVAMINESFEEQQRQYKLYGDELKSVFYSAPDADLPLYPQPVAVPDNDEPLYNDEAIYRWREETSPLMQIGSDFLVDDVMNNSLPNMNESECKLSFPSHFVGDDSSQMSSSCARQILMADDDASATALASAKFVLGSLDSPYKTPSDIDDVPMIIDTKKEIVDSNYLSEDEELAQAWEGIERFGVSVDGIRYYIPRNVSPSIATISENLVEPPKNIKALGHVTEIFEASGELDSEPVLKYFKSIGMKNFYQRDIDIQRAFLVFATVDEAKFAVENNKTSVQMRLLEESPQFVKMKALNMHSELMPCSFKENIIKPTFSSVHPHVLESIAGV